MASPVDSTLAAALSELWRLDANRLVPGRDYILDAQQRAYGDSDAADAPLITTIDPSVWQRPTFAAFKHLLDNYTAATGVPERVSDAERAEEHSFIAAVCDTDVMRFAFDWLSNHSSMRCSSITDFSAMLHAIWFQCYSRDGCRDSSGFEHVFCGEIDDGVVKGLHNFVQVYVEEARGNFNYKGYLDVRGEPCRDPPPPEQQLITVRFEWLGKMKPVSSMFVGVSPEFELAMYTMMFVAGDEALEVDLGPYRARVKVYQIAGKIGTAYPELLAVDRSQFGTDSAKGGAIPAVAGGALAGGLGFGALKKLDQKQVKNHLKMAQVHLKGRKRKGKHHGYGVEIEGDEEEEGDTSDGDSSDENGIADEEANGHADTDSESQHSLSSSASGSEHAPYEEEAEEAPAEDAHPYQGEPAMEEPAEGAYPYHGEPATEEPGVEALPVEDIPEAPAAEEAFTAHEAVDFGAGEGEEEGDPLGDLCAECCTIA